MRGRIESVDGHAFVVIASGGEIASGEAIRVRRPCFAALAITEDQPSPITSRKVCASSLRSNTWGAMPRLLSASFSFSRRKALVV